MIGKLLFHLAKSPLMGRVVGLGFQHFCGLLPVRKVFLSKEVLAFHHPKPCYENHIILSPRKPVRNLQQLASAAFSYYFEEIWKAAQQVCAAQFQSSHSFVLMANGGKRQKVQQVHFHLFTNPQMIGHTQGSSSCFYRDDILEVLEQQVQNERIHFRLLPVSEGKADSSAYFRSVLQTIDRLDETFRFAENGYALICQFVPENGNWKYPVFHIVFTQKASKKEVPQ